MHVSQGRSRNSSRGGGGSGPRKGRAVAKVKVKKGRSDVKVYVPYGRGWMLGSGMLGQHDLRLVLKVLNLGRVLQPTGV